MESCEKKKNNKVCYPRNPGVGKQSDSDRISSPKLA